MAVHPGRAGEDADQTVELVVSLDQPKATGSLDQAPVDASITTEVRKGVLAVPVNALLALAEGGYAVEVERDGRRELWGWRRACSPTARSRSPARAWPPATGWWCRHDARRHRPALELREVVSATRGRPRWRSCAGSA